MVRLAGIEPATFGFEVLLKARRATTGHNEAHEDEDFRRTALWDVVSLSVGVWHKTGTNR